MVLLTAHQGWMAYFVFQFIGKAAKPFTPVPQLCCVLTVQCTFSPFSSRLYQCHQIIIFVVIYSGTFHK